jgi:HEAT repeat protein
MKMEAKGPVAAAAPSPALPTLSPDEQTLKAAHLPLDGPGLLDFLRQRSRIEVKPDDVAALIRRLGDKTPAVHEKAFGDLVAFGPLAVAALRQAANDLESVETPARARRCLQAIEGNVLATGPGVQTVYYGQVPYVPGPGGAVATASGAGIPAAAARVVAIRRPPGATAVLLGYLPCADDATVTREVENTLAVVAFRARKPDPELVKALGSPLPQVRGAAAALICRVGGAEQQPLVKPLLQDPKPSVRLRAAIGLADLHDADAVPVLLDLLTQLSAALRAQAQAYLARLSGEWAVTVPQGEDELAQRLRRDLWAAWWQRTDGPAVLAEFRRRTPSNADREQALGLLRQLGDPSAAVREQAATALVALGDAALPLLRQAVHQDDPRIAPYAVRCLQQFDGNAPGPLPNAAIGLLMLRKPAGATEALLAYLPFAETRAAEAQLQTALAVVGIRDGRPDPALVRGLEDRVAQRRVAAAEVLARADLPEQRPAVRRLLQDPEPDVRLRVAMALAAARDKEAVPVLITLLGDLPAEQGLEVEEFLTRLAGTDGPADRWDGAAATRGQRRDTWAAWWRTHGLKLDLNGRDNLDWLFGHTLVVEMVDSNLRTGRVLELDRHGRPCWEIDGLLGPVDAQVLPGGRVLIAEQAANRVSERDLKGTILWQRPLATPLGCHALPNGHAFLVGRSQLVEVDRTGNEVHLYPRPQQDVMAARKLADGQIVIISNGLMCTRLDAAGKEIKTFRLGNLQYAAGSFEILPTGGLLVSQPWINKIVEMDAEGQLVRDFTAPQPAAASRLANGNTLIASQQYPMKVLELDRDGRVVWESKETLRPTRVRRR